MTAGIGFIIMALLAVPFPDASPDELFARGNALFDEGRFQDAVRAYRSIESAGYSSAGLDQNLGLALAHADESGEAVYYLTRAARRGDADPRVVEMLQEIRRDLHLADAHISGRDLRHYSWWMWIAGSFAVGVSVLGLIPGRTPRRKQAATWILLAGVLLTGASVGASALAERQAPAIIVRGPAMVYDSFDSLAPTGAVLSEGEAVRLTDARGARNEVRLDGRLVGWIDRHRLRQL